MPFNFQSYSGASDDDAGGDEDQEEPSSSPHQDVDALRSFREQWQRELEISPKHAVQPQAIRGQVLDNHVLDGNNGEKKEDASIETKVRIHLDISVRFLLE